MSGTPGFDRVGKRMTGWRGLCRGWIMLIVLLSLATASAAEPSSRPQVRGTWLTTTANEALSTPHHTEQTMRKLRAIGLNTVYIEAWKNGYTQFPSEALRKVIGVRERPAGREQDPADSRTARNQPGRDLLGEAVMQAHRQGLLAIAWFEYGFMAAHGSTLNHLRQMKPEWLSRDRQGREVAPNGFVWLNPLHPQAREFLLDLVLEAIDRYDLDGIQLDDRIVWPHVTMGYDDYTVAAYAAEHHGATPPSDPHDPQWMAWRAAKVDEYARWFVQEVRARRPGLVISLSPAVYPWSWDNYLLNWPRWTAWTAAHGIQGPPVREPAARITAPRWDEFIPQAYRMSYVAFEETWVQQTRAVQEAGGYRPHELVAGIRVVGEGPDSSWDQLRQSIELVDRMGQGGHVLWFSKGVLERYPAELQRLYTQQGRAHSPRFPPGWRPPARNFRALDQPGPGAGPRTWRLEDVAAGHYRLIGRRSVPPDIRGAHQTEWHELRLLHQREQGHIELALDREWSKLELLVDRRPELSRTRFAARDPVSPHAAGQFGAPWPEPAWRSHFPGVELTRLQVHDPRLAVLHVARVDLRTPCLHWMATPPAEPQDAPLAPPGRHTPETVGLKTSTFLSRFGLQLAINAAPFGPVVDQEGLLQDVAGFQVSQGRAVSGPTKEYPALLMMRDGRTLIQGPPFPSEGVLTAVGGFDIVLRNGLDVSPKRSNPPVHPRTAIGVSADGRWLWLMVVDGRQPGYSLGATLHDLAAWLRFLGASDGINLDGGGTSTLVIEGHDGRAEVINRPIHRNQPGMERVSASHLGLWVSDVPKGTGARSSATDTGARHGPPVCN